jgi:hypothetical protein
VLGKRGDRLTARKFLLAYPAHFTALKKRVEVLRQRDREDNRNEARAIGRLGEQLDQLRHEASTLASRKNPTGS